MFSSQLWAFIGISVLITITPGVDTMLVIRNTLLRGRKAGLITAIAICASLFCHATLSALGLSLLLVRSATLYEIVKLLGACYLFYLGGRSLWQTFRPSAAQRAASAHAEQVETAQAKRTVDWRRSVREGFLSNILNPKVAVFYLAFLPQFINPGDPVLAKSLFLASIHFTEGILWLALVSLFVGWLRGFLTRPAVRRGMEAVTGVVLIAFGVRLALERQ